MTKILERNKGNAKTGNVRFKLPETMSALSLLGNKIYDGDEFHKDGFVYRNNQKIRKYFAWRDGWNHFWQPCLEQVARIENIYFKLKTKEQIAYNKLLELYKKIKNKAHYCSNKTWFEFSIGPRGGTGYSVLLNPPNRPMNLKLGKKIYEEEHKKIKWFSQISILFNDAMTLFIRKTFPEKADRIYEVFEVEVNSRKYIYSVLPTKVGGIITKLNCEKINKTSV